MIHVSLKGSYSSPKVVSEIGCNHKGDFAIAKDLLKLSKDAGVYAAKFQKRNNRELLTAEQYDAPHPNPSNAYGKTYGEHREFLEFNLDQHSELKKYSESIGLVYSTSVWDTTSAQEIVQLNPEFIKVPSACNNHFKMLEVLRDNYKGMVHISTGMTTVAEQEEFVKFFEAKGQAKRLVVYSCTSGYPVPFQDVCLLEILKMQDRFHGRIGEFAFSGHHLGIAIDCAAYTLGATWIERHFTKDRTWKGTDHAASLEFAGLQKLCRDVKATYQSLTFKETEILPIEAVQRDKLKYRVR